MFAALKKAIKTSLRRRNFFLTYVFPEDLTGFDLEDDLRRVMGTKPPLIFDVGANEGQTIRMMQRVFGSPRILAFEPSPRAFAALQKEKENFGPSVSLSPLGLGSSPGRRVLHEYEHNYLDSFHDFADDAGNPFRDIKEHGTVEAAVETVDRIVEREDIERLDLLKIDTQGHDLEVLRGALGCLAAGKIGHVLVEMNYQSLYEGQPSASDLQAFLLTHGFRLVDLYEKHRHQHAIAWCTALFVRD